MAWTVWLPPEMQVHGKFLEVLPQVTSHTFPRAFRPFRQPRGGRTAYRLCPVISDSGLDIKIRPSGLMTKSPSNPMEPPT